MDQRKNNTTRVPRQDGVSPKPPGAVKPPPPPAPPKPPAKAGNASRIGKALAIAQDFAGVDGAHHKDWIIDQMVRALTGKKYKAWVRQCRNGKDGPNTYEWDIGIAP